MATEIGMMSRHIRRLRADSGDGIRPHFVSARQARPETVIARAGAAGAGHLPAEDLCVPHGDQPAQGWSRYKLPAGMPDRGEPAHDTEHLDL